MIEALEKMAARIGEINRRLRALETTERSTGFIDYSAISTITGWSAYTIKAIGYSYSKPEKMVVVQYRITGTSNSVSTNFSLPFAQQGLLRLRAPVFCVDNGAAGVIGVAEILFASNTVTFYPTPALGAWTAAGTKEIAGQFVYFTT